MAKTFHFQKPDFRAFSAPRFRLAEKQIYFLNLLSIRFIPLLF